MQVLLNKANQYFEQVPEQVKHNRLKIWIGFLILTVLVVVGIPQIKLDMSMEAFFQQDDPVKQAYDHFRDIFGSDEIVYIVYEAKDGDIFSEASLTALKGVQDELMNYGTGESEESPLDHITEVKTLLNVSYLETSEGSLVSRDFIGDELPADDAEREKLRQEALNHPDYPLFYLSKNSQYGGILIRTDFGTTRVGDQDNSGDDWETGSEWSEVPIGQSEAQEEGTPQFKKTDMNEYAAFMKPIKEILGNPQYTKILIFHPVGNPVLMDFFFEVFEIEMGFISLGLIILIIGTLFLLFRSFSAVIWPLSIVILSVLWTLGLVGWSGVTMTFMVQIIVFLVLTIGIADTVHIFSGYLFFRNQEFDHASAMRAVFRKSALACLLTSTTTAVGLLALIFVPIVPIRNFGIFAAIGVFLAFIFTIILLPLMLEMWNPFSKKRIARLSQTEEKEHVIQRGLRKIEHISYHYPLPIIAIFLIVGIFAGYGLSKVRIDSNMVKIIKEGLPIRNTYQLVDEQMGGSQNIEVFIDMGQSGALKDPEVLNVMEAFQKDLENQYKDIIVKTTSLVNVAKDSFKALNEGRPDMYRIPQGPNVLAQTLFLFESANPEDREQLVSEDYQMGRINVNLKNIGTEEAEIMVRSIQERLNTLFDPLKEKYPDLKVTLTGAVPLMAIMVNYISWSQLQSFGLALLVITILFLVLFGSKRVGLLAMIPNVFPVLTTMGMMGWLGVALDADTMLIAPIVIGIAVDDTIHFLTHYRAELRETKSINKAIRKTFRETGQAISFTSLILSIGYLVFIFSVHQGMSYFGTMSAVAILTALLSDLFLLPALCTVFHADFGFTKDNVNLKIKGA